MNTREEEIAEMAKHLCSSFNSEYCHHDCPEFCDCRVLVHCEGLQYAGYRKQSDTAREILQKLIYNITANNTNDGYLSESIDYSSTIDDIKKLAKEYGAEVEE